MGDAHAERGGMGLGETRGSGFGKKMKKKKVKKKIKKNLVPPSAQKISGPGSPNIRSQIQV